MKFIQFILKKIIIVELMLVMLVGCIQLFSLNIPRIYSILITVLHFLTPISLFSLIGYVILCFFTKNFIEILLTIGISGLILYYFLIVKK